MTGASPRNGRAFFSREGPSRPSHGKVATPAEIPFTQPQAMVRYVTDTGKILPRKYTGLCAKHQRAVTKTIKQSRNMLLAQ